MSHNNLPPIHSIHVLNSSDLDFGSFRIVAHTYRLHPRNRNNWCTCQIYTFAKCFHQVCIKYCFGTLIEINYSHKKNFVIHLAEKKKIIQGKNTPILNSLVETCLNGTLFNIMLHSVICTNSKNWMVLFVSLCLL